ncbi:MAG TPA: hypothetical protein VFA65_13665 [Bryobacteraceae bacterium]|nr:hypothetical protein [Bryobacteraceae bacterium]
MIYAVLDNFNPKTNSAAPNSGSPPARDVVGGEVYRTEDSGATWHKMNSANEDVSRKTGYAFNQIRVDPNNSEHIFITGSNLISSEDGGKTWAGLGRGGPSASERPFRRAFGDFRTLWIDPQDSDHMIAGSDGGVFVSYDGGRTCDHFSNLKLGEVYAVGVDMEKPYNIFAGLQDHESWMGPSNGPSGSVGIEDWKTVGIGDGQYNAADPNGRYEYNDQEFGHAVRVDLQERTKTVIAPVAPAGRPPLRINWTAPLVLSPHDSKTVYFGAEMVFRSRDRGDHWDIISPDLTTNDPKKISGPRSAIQHCTITTLAESPAQVDVIWAGTDDGKVQVTRDGGQHWTDTTTHLAAAGGPPDAWVTRVFPSRFDPATVYVTKSRRRQDDFRPFVLRSTDFGATWTMLTDGLTNDSAPNVIAEDKVKSNLLFLGTDKGLYVSFDRGGHWEAFRANMPPAPVHDLLVHPREGDLIAGTFGRGIWVTNIVPLREFQPALLTETAHLFATKPFSERRDVAWGNYALYGDRYPVTRNEPNGMVISFLLKSVPQDGVQLQITDGSGKVLRHIRANPKAGINRSVWLLDDDSGAPVPAGDYTINLLAGGRTLSQPAHLLSRAPEDSPRPRRFQRESTGANGSEDEIP